MATSDLCSLRCISSHQYLSGWYAERLAPYGTQNRLGGVRSVAKCTLDVSLRQLCASVVQDGSEKHIAAQEER